MSKIRLSWEERIAMYEKLDKRELIELLLDTQEQVSEAIRHSAPIFYLPSQAPSGNGYFSPSNS